MEQFYKWFNSSPLASFARHFFALVLAAAIAEFSRVGSFDVTNWKAWVIAALVAAAPPLLKYLWQPIDG